MVYILDLFSTLFPVKCFSSANTREESICTFNQFSEFMIFALSIWSIWYLSYITFELSIVLKHMARKEDASTCASMTIQLLM